MKIKRIFLPGLLYFAIIFSLTMPTSPPAQASPAIVYVPDDYLTIQAAVDIASDGDTIIVRDGTYTENVDITKLVTIQSEKGAGSTSVTAANSDEHVFYVTAEDVTISGFTVTGATGEKRAGIYLGDGAAHCTISNNIISNNYYGIHLDSSSNNTLRNNTCHYNSQEGIFLWSSCNNNTIDNNTSYSNGGHGGIFLWKFCQNNTITNNTCHSNPDHGIKIHESSDNNLLENNACFNNEHEGIFVGFSDNNTLKNNTCNSNTQSGIFLRVSNYNLVANNTCEFNESGMCLDFCNFQNTLENNVCSNNECGIRLRLSSSSNRLINNTCNSNSRAGIGIAHSNYNEVFYNTLKLNRMVGVSIEGGELISMQGGEKTEWDEFKRMEGYWSKFKEQVQARGVKIESKNSEGNKISWNNIESNGDWGVEIKVVGVGVDATLNWWGDLSGPSGAGSGKGDAVSTNVIYSPWLDVPYPEGKPVTESEAKEEPTQPQPVIPPEPVPTPTPKPALAPAPTPTAPAPVPTPAPLTPEGINWCFVIGIVAGVVIIGSAIYFFIRRRRRV